jgi:hypothetical protein
MGSTTIAALISLRGNSPHAIRYIDPARFLTVRPVRRRFVDSLSQPDTVALRPGTRKAIADSNASSRSTEVADVAQSGRQRTDLVAALQALSGGEWGSVSAEATVGQLADLLLHALPLQPEQRHLAFTELDALARAGMALAWHAAGDDESAAE